MPDTTPENTDVIVEINPSQIKKFLTKHKTTIVLGAALAVSVTLNVVQKAMVLPGSLGDWELHYVSPEALACLEEHMSEDTPLFPQV